MDIAMIVKINERNLENLMTEPGYFLLVATAGWCAPCKTVHPLIEDLAILKVPKLKIAQFDIDDDPEMAMEFKIRGVPCFILSCDGEAVGTKVGVSSRDDLYKWLREYKMLVPDVS